METPNDGSDLLNQEQVDALNEGAKVSIIWCGGNGPHIYTIKKSKDGSNIAKECNQFIDFVGATKPYTVVRLISE